MVIQIDEEVMEKLLYFIDNGGKNIRLQSKIANVKVEIKG